MGIQNELGGSMKTLFTTSLTEYSATDKEGLGTIRVTQDNKRYRWVKNSSTTTAARAGSPACFDASNVTQTYFLQYVAPEAVVAGDVPFFAGVWMSNVPAGYYGWVQTYGVYDDARVAAASAVSYAVGDYLKPNVSTDTAATGASAPYSFTLNILPTAVVGTGAGTAAVVGDIMAPQVILCETLATRSTAALLTTAQTLSVFIKGTI